MKCPFCGSTDVAEMIPTPTCNKDRICLECDGKWKAGGKRNEGRNATYAKSK